MPPLGSGRARTQPSENVLRTANNTVTWSYLIQIPSNQEHSKKLPKTILRAPHPVLLMSTKVVPAPPVPVPLPAPVPAHTRVLQRVCACTDWLVFA